MRTAITIAIVLLVLICAKSQKQIRVEWMNDAVLISTNTVLDGERNKTNGTSIFFYTKTVIVTNRVDPFYFRAGDKSIELGAREDGVMVWRHSGK